MWTAKNRGRYDRSKLRYPSDLTDDEWAHVEPLIPPANHALRLLEWLYQPIQKDPIKATVMPTDAALVVFVEGVHERPRPTQPQQGTAAHGRRSATRRRKGYQGRSPWLVRPALNLVIWSGSLRCHEMTSDA
jgi:hypothetical protein